MKIKCYNCLQVFEIVWGMSTIVECIHCGKKSIIDGLPHSVIVEP